MTKFEDGPAKGQVLMLRRAPLFLRVAHTAQRVDPSPWDALDQLSDEPRSCETFYAYRCTGRHGNAFIDFGGKKKHLSGMYTSATYEYYEEQPPQEIMANNEEWRAWCRKEQRESRVAHCR